MSSVTSQRVKMERLRVGLSQDELAEKLGFGRTNIANYESGRVKPPSDVIAKMTKIFNVTSDYLLGLDDIEIDGLGPALASEMEQQNIQAIDICVATGAYPQEIEACLNENIGLSETLLDRVLTELGLSLGDFLNKHDLFDSEIPAHFDGDLDKYLKYKKTEALDAQNEPLTIAAHHDGEDWTEEELQDIEEFKEILKLKRQLKKNKE